MGACVVVVDSTSNEEIVLWSETIEIPDKKDRPFDEGPEGEWSVLKDPHSIITKGIKSRKDFLVDALLKLQRR